MLLLCLGICLLCCCVSVLWAEGVGCFFACFLSVRPGVVSFLEKRVSVSWN